MSRFLDDNATGTNGVTPVVNGIEANGPGVTPSAVEEVRINNSPYSARFSRPGRARLEIITKGGSWAYHGSLNFMFRDSVFDASNAFAAVKPPERRRYYEGSITGPIGHGKHTSFLLALDERPGGPAGCHRSCGHHRCRIARLRPLGADGPQPHSSLLRLRTDVPRLLQRRPVLDR
jgi:hypothetical protein